MPRHPELYQWIDTIAMHFPSLSKPQALGLALWSFGMVVARSCSLTAVADVLSPLLGKKYNTLRERLRALLGFVGGRQRGLLPSCRRAASLPRPFGLIPTKPAMLGAANGIKRVTS
ncbi:hypothetical protein [Methylovulum psychrotolerans]|uniref:Uncharacterized protein n=1 Tax=Methylovulum psychrotolerans TaxID=1704499 RepID=A0A1Z4BZP2_9GAMM|nr:hypothetical protein [Methylovulum psychrotolerans]ASF46757.1 hypothetical protein CEK71_12100 [Methylovulum psychrotolerans]